MAAAKKKSPSEGGPWGALGLGLLIFEIKFIP
jgi:hypothetical protein